jgi:hypothetical protein
MLILLSLSYRVKNKINGMSSTQNPARNSLNFCLRTIFFISKNPVFGFYPSSTFLLKMHHTIVRTVQNRFISFYTSRVLQHAVKSYDMGPTALLLLRRKSCYGYLSPLKIHRPRPGLIRRTLGRMASTLITKPLRATLTCIRSSITVMKSKNTR